MRLIDAEPLQKKFEGLREKDSHTTGANAYDLCAMLTEDAPTIEAEPVRHGYWRFCGSDRWNDAHVCSECGKIAMNDSNYCPKCGAKMDGGCEK